GHKANFTTETQRTRREDESSTDFADFDLRKDASLGRKSRLGKPAGHTTSEHLLLSAEICVIRVSASLIQRNNLNRFYLSYPTRRMAISGNHHSKRCGVVGQWLSV